MLDAGAHSLAELAITRSLPGLEGAERDRALYRLGKARRHMGNLAGAESAFERIPPESPWYPQAMSELADVYAIQGKAGRTIKALKALIQTLPARDALPVRLRLGDELLTARDYEGAIAAYRPLHDCDDPVLREAAWYGAGWAATRAGLHARALWFWQQAIREFPRSPRIREARLNLANHYLRMGRLGFAAEQLRAVSQEAVDLAERERRPEAIAWTAEFVAAEAAVQAGDWVRAIDHYREAGRSPRWAEASAYGIGWALWQAGRLPEAEDALEKCLEDYPKGRFKAAARYALGRVQQDRGRKSEATESYKAVLAYGKSRWAEEALFQLAGLELLSGKPLGAIQWCRRLVADYPTGRMATAGLWLLAESQLASGAISDAIESYARLASKPESLSFLEGKGNRVLFKLGLAYFKAGDLESAEAAFRQVRPDAGPLAGEATFWRAETLYRQGRFSEAAEAYESVLARHGDSPKVPEAAYGLGWAELRRGRKGPAMWAFKTAAEGLLDKALKRDAYQRLAMLQLDAGQYKEAQKALQRVVELDASADPTEGAFYLAWSQMRAGEFEEAAKGFRNIADRSPDSARGRQARTFQAQILMRLGRFTEAARAFEALADLPPLEDATDDLDPRMRAAAAYMSGNDPARAAMLYARIVAEASASVAIREQALRPLAEAYLKAGMLPQAESVLTTEASGSPWVPSLLIEVARGYAKAGKWQEAAAAYGQVPAPESAVMLERARSLRKAGDPLGASELYRFLAAPTTPLGKDVKRSTIQFELFDAYDEAGLFDSQRDVLEALEREVAPGSAEAEQLGAYWYRLGERALGRGDPQLAVTAFRASERRVARGSVAAWKARYSLGSALVEARRFEDALFELSQLTAAREPKGTKEPLTAYRAWKALAWLKQGEALEKMRRWDEAAGIYQSIGADWTVPERERQEAQARLAWIKANVKKPRPQP